MDYEIKPFDETTYDDANALTYELFDPKPGSVLSKILANPLRKELNASSSGELVYQGGRAVAFQAAILRKLYIRQKPFIGVTGSTLCSRAETSPVLLMQLMKATIKSRYGSELFFANTANVASMKMNRLLGVKGIAPVTCERTRFGICWVPPFIKKWIKPPKAQRVNEIDDRVFDDFWRRYLKNNKGVVSSRTAKELRWMFGDEMKSGDSVMLGLFGDEGSLDGYVVIRSTHGGRRWMLMDWIAVDNNPDVLKFLLESAMRFIRRESNALLFEMIGYPVYADVIARKVLPFVRRAKNNSFLWKFTGSNLTISEDSWFWGAYDGDRALG